VGSLVWLFTIVSFIGLLISFFIALLVVSISVVPVILTGGIQITLFLITPIPIGFLTLTGYSYLAWFVFIFIAIILSVLWLFLKSTKDTWASIRKPLGDLKSRFASRSTISMIAQLFAAILFFDLVYLLVISLLGATPATQLAGSYDQWEFMFLLANASVYEEIITRILFIGLPLLLMAIASNVPLKRKTIHRYFLGGGFELNRTTMILLTFSSFMFAAAHILSWDIYKVPPTFMAGMALGYLYLKKGIFASILLHFSFNYFVVLGMLIEDNLVAYAFLSILLFMLTIAGAFFFSHYAIRASRFFSRESQVEPQYIPPRRPYFQCPRCGGQEARYSHGTFECLNCNLRV
jgi:hypothetical protein